MRHAPPIGIEGGAGAVGPARRQPSAMTAAFIAPADVPEIPSILIQGSSRSRSRTPQVKAPCEPPPCKARLTRTGRRSVAAALSIVELISSHRPRNENGLWDSSLVGSCVIWLSHPAQTDAGHSGQHTIDLQPNSTVENVPVDLAVLPDVHEFLAGSAIIFIVSSGLPSSTFQTSYKRRADEHRAPMNRSYASRLALHAEGVRLPDIASARPSPNCFGYRAFHGFPNVVYPGSVLGARPGTDDRQRRAERETRGAADALSDAR